jgi:hypothetical protein
MYIGAVSPDGKKMVAVGDSKQVFLYEITNSSYNRIATINGKVERKQTINYSKAFIKSFFRRWFFLCMESIFG